MRRRLLLAVPLILGGCALRRHKPEAAAPSVRSVLGPPYQAGGVWRYPRASYDADETGLAAVVEHHGTLAADGAPWDPSVLMGAHPTLQVPSVVRVTNLETGRQILLRLDDRGPDSAALLLAVTPRAAVLLGGGSEPGVLRVRVQVEEAPSRQLAAQLGDPDAPKLVIAAAPAVPVQTEALGAGPAVSAGLKLSATSDPHAATVVPLRLPEAVIQFPVRRTELWIDAGGLGQPRYAELLRGRLSNFGATVVRSDMARPEVAYRVRIGPLANVADAQAMLDRVLRAGVVDARIIIIQ